MAGSYLRLIDFCITQLKAQGPSRTCNESKEEEEDFTEIVFRVEGLGHLPSITPLETVTTSHSVSFDPKSNQNTTVELLETLAKPALGCLFLTRFVVPSGLVENEQ